MDVGPAKAPGPSRRSLGRLRGRSPTSHVTHVACSMSPAACSRAIWEPARVIAEPGGVVLYRLTCGEATASIFPIDVLKSLRRGDMSESRLAGVPMFRGLGEERLARLECRLEEKHFGPNEI